MGDWNADGDSCLGLTVSGGGDGVENTNSALVGEMRLAISGTGMDSPKEPRFMEVGENPAPFASPAQLRWDAADGPLLCGETGVVGFSGSDMEIGSSTLGTSQPGSSPTSTGSPWANADSIWTGGEGISVPSNSRVSAVGALESGLLGFPGREK